MNAAIITANMRTIARIRTQSVSGIIPVQRTDFRRNKKLSARVGLARSAFFVNGVGISANGHGTAFTFLEL